MFRCCFSWSVLYLTVFNYSSCKSFGTAFIWHGRRRCFFVFRSSVAFMATHKTSTQSVTISRPVDPLHELGLPRPLLLGSASFTRKQILKEMGVDFHKVVRPIDERDVGDRSQDSPVDLVLNIAQAKMDHLIQEIKGGRCDLPDRGFGNTKGWVVLTGDQVVTCNGAILEKPESVEEAKEFVGRYGQNPPSTVGSCVLAHLPSGIQVSGVDSATIYFSPHLPADDLIERLLLEDDAPIMSCAGGLMIEHPFVKEYIDRIDGTEDSVMGLSKDLVWRLLKELSEKLNREGVL
jgi:septum formation protein